MGKLLKSLISDLSSDLAPRPAEVTAHELHRRAQSAAEDLFRHLYLGNLVYRDGTIISQIEDRKTAEDKRSCARCLKMAQHILDTGGFFLPVTWENWEITINALETGLFTVSVNKHGVFGLWWADGSWRFDDPWRAVQAGRLAIEQACSFDNSPLPTDVAGCLAVLRKYYPFTGKGDMERGSVPQWVVEAMSKRQSRG